MTQEPILWQPAFASSSYDFSVRFDGAYATQLARKKVPLDNQNRLDILGSEILARRNLTVKQPYRFRAESALVTAVHLDIGGRWLACGLADDRPLESALQEGNLVYHTHNIDTLPDQVALLHLFSTWIAYADHM